MARTSTSQFGGAAESDIKVLGGFRPIRSQTAGYPGSPLDLKIPYGVCRQPILRKVHAFERVFRQELVALSWFVSGSRKIFSLPSSGRATTTYPCRIRHVSGKAIPELYLSKSLENGLSCLRQFNWLEKYKGYNSEPRTWTGNDLHTNIKASNMVYSWNRAPMETKNNYRSFMDPSFTIPDVVRGEKEVLDWVGLVSTFPSCKAY